MKTRLKEIMTEKGVMSKKLAETMGVSNVTISTLINGKVNNLDTLARAAEALDVPLWQLFATKEEVQQTAARSFVCPHCGRELRISIE